MESFDSEELNRIAKLSETKTFSLWYDEENGFSVDYPATDSSHWIFDIEQPETPEFIAEITRIILESLGDF